MIQFSKKKKKKKNIKKKKKKKKNVLKTFQNQTPEVFCKRAVLKNFAIFTVKHLFSKPYFKKFQAFMWYAKFLRTRNLKNIRHISLLSRFTHLLTFCTLWKHPKNKVYFNFLIFSGGIKKYRCNEIEWQPFTKF